MQYLRPRQPSTAPSAIQSSSKAAATLQVPGRSLVQDLPHDSEQLPNLVRAPRASVAGRRPIDRHLEGNFVICSGIWMIAPQITNVPLKRGPQRRRFLDHGLCRGAEFRCAPAGRASNRKSPMIFIRSANSRSTDPPCLHATFNLFLFPNRGASRLGIRPGAGGRLPDISSFTEKIISRSLEAWAFATPNPTSFAMAPMSRRGYRVAQAQAKPFSYVSREQESRSPPRSIASVRS